MIFAALGDVFNIVLHGNSCGIVQQCAGLGLFIFACVVYLILCSARVTC